MKNKSKFNHRDRGTGREERDYLRRQGSQKAAGRRPASSGDTALSVINSALRSVTESVRHTCHQLGYLPLKAAEGIAMGRFVCSVIRRAQEAQRASGVPASILVAKAACDAYWEPEARFLTGKGNWFMQEAKRLAKNRRFQPVLAAAQDVIAYVRELRRCSVWNPERCEDVADLLVSWSLYDCDDLTGMSSGARYSRSFEINQQLHPLETGPWLVYVPTEVHQRELLPQMQKEGALLAGEIPLGSQSEERKRFYAAVEAKFGRIASGKGSAA